MSATRTRITASLRSAAAGVYWATGDALASLTGKVLILLYHRVIPRDEVDKRFVQPGMYVTPETFDHHLRFISDHFTVLSFQTLLDMWEDGSWDPTARYCVLTFDDGWRDNKTYAYPLLRAYRVPATIFVPTDVIGTLEWLWPDRLAYLLRHVDVRGVAAGVREPLGPLASQWLACAAAGGQEDAVIELTKTLPDRVREELLRRLGDASIATLPGDRVFLDWDEARELSNHGIAFGSHTCSHPALTRLDEAQLGRELRQPLDVLRRERVNHVPVLSYPYGDHGDDVVAAARAAGYRAAVTTCAGLESSRPADFWRLHRIGVHDDVTRSATLLAFHVARQSRRARSVA